MRSDFNHQAGRAIRDEFYRALAANPSQKIRDQVLFEKEHVASLMASAARQSVQNCILILASSESLKDAADKLARLIAVAPAKETTNG